VREVRITLTFGISRVAEEVWLALLLLLRGLRTKNWQRRSRLYPTGERLRDLSSI
jgi:hypothetical protein